MIILTADVALAAHLLLALPQSSSTSTAEQLAHMGNFTQEQAFTCYTRRRYASGSIFAPLNRHSDVCDQDSRFLQGTVWQPRLMRKQHWPPTANNVQGVLAGLRDTTRFSDGLGVVILTRDPQASLHARCEREVAASGLFTRLEGLCANGTEARFEACMADARVKDRAAAKQRQAKWNAYPPPQLLSALHEWSDGWIKASQSEPTKFLHIRYEDLEATPGSREELLQRVLAFWRLPQVRPFDDVHNKKTYVHTMTPVCDAAWNVTAKRPTVRDHGSPQHHAAHDTSHAFASKNGGEHGTPKSSTASTRTGART
jgi:hypothetical protein